MRNSFRVIQGQHSHNRNRHRHHAFLGLASAEVSRVHHEQQPRRQPEGQQRVAGKSSSRPFISRRLTKIFSFFSNATTCSSKIWMASSSKSTARRSTLTATTPAAPDCSLLGGPCSAAWRGTTSGCGSEHSAAPCSTDLQYHYSTALYRKVQYRKLSQL